MLLIQFIQYLAFLWIALVTLRWIQGETSGNVQRALSYALH